MTRCLVSFGSNLGDRGALLLAAADEIERLPQVNDLHLSRLYSTPAIGGPKDQPPFLNAAASLTTESSAAELLRHLQRIEANLGRERTTRWAARKIDLDLILFGDFVGQQESLLLPHPRYVARRFVIEPAREIAAEMTDPRFDWSIDRIAEHFAIRTPSAVLVGGDATTRRLIGEQLQWRHKIVVCCSPETAKAQDKDQPWVGDFGGQCEAEFCQDPLGPAIVMRLLRHSQSSTRRDWFDDAMRDEQSWPSPQQLWPRGRHFPEYGLDVGDPTWAADEIASALISMQCDCQAVQTTGR